MPTVAETLGSTPHLSPLLRRVRRLGLSNPRSLLRLAAARGCSHYAPPGEDSPSADPGRDVLGDEELSLAMLSAAQAYDPALVRCAVQLLSGDEIDPHRVLALARQERCLPVLRHVARAALSVDPHQRLWADILASTDRVAEAKPGRLPHPSRFMSIAGRGRDGRSRPPLWLKPRRDAVSSWPSMR